MAMAATRKVSFNGGVVAPYLDGRIDLARFQTGCIDSTNQIPCDWGGSVTRPGLIYDQRLNRDTILHSFIVSSSSRFLLLFSPNELRIVKDHLIVQSGGSDLVIPTPYKKEDLYELKIDSLVDLLWVVHPFHPPYQLKRYADDDWSFGEITLNEPPTIPRENESAKVTPSATSGTITITSDEDLFEAGHVGGLWKIGHESSEWVKEISLEGTTNVTSTGMTVFGDWSFTTSGNWRGRLEIQRSSDGSTDWKTIREFAARSELRNISTTGTEKEVVYLRVLFFSDNNTQAAIDDAIEDAAEKGLEYSIAQGDYNTLYARSKDDSLSSGDRAAYATEAAAAKIVANDAAKAKALADKVSLDTRSAPQYNPQASLEVATNEVYGVVRITGYTDARTVTADVQGDLYGTSATNLWREAAWSPKRGYPSAITLYERRLVLAASMAFPNRLWASAQDDRKNFLVLDEEDGALAFDLTTRDVTNWLIGAERIMAGTRQEEVVISSGRDDLPLSPKNTSAKVRGSIGSSRVQAIRSSNTVLYAERRGRRIRQVAEDAAYGTYNNEDITAFAPHLFDSSVLQMTAGQWDQKLVFVLLTNRKLLCLNHNTTQQITSWFTIETEGDFESVATLSGDTTEDIVYVVTRRTINGDEVRQLEHFAVDQWEDIEQSDTTNMVYSDMARVFENVNAVSEITGLEDWEGMELQVLGDGAVQPNKIVINGRIELTYSARVTVVGLPYSSKLTPLWFDDMNSPTQGRKRKVAKVYTSLYQGGNVTMRATDEDKFGDLQEGEQLQAFTVPRRVLADSIGSAPKLENGYYETSLDSRHSRKQSITFERNSPLPMIIQSLHLIYNVGEK